MSENAVFALLTILAFIGSLALCFIVSIVIKAMRKDRDHD